MHVHMYAYIYMYHLKYDAGMNSRFYTSCSVKRSGEYKDKCCFASVYFKFDSNPDSVTYRSNMCVVVCCSVLQYVAVCCNMLQCVAVCCKVVQ